MLRTLVVIGLSAALQAGALSAPLLHAHLDGHDDDHHGAARVHAHAAAHGSAHRHAPPGAAAIEESEDAGTVARFQLFVAVHPGAPDTPALPRAEFPVAAGAASVLPRPPEQVRVHGPPPVDRSTPRAPPARPVLI